ncbi:MAG: cobalt ABC transporter permease [Gammaproteobacteria bacterium]|nr:MAG: cobalt ABC transporter permease [Pseudomonadota bacterium]PIE38041.1 MAG: cobalt ABC transporter permease [Gammaproteobacteria bacterium]
MQLKSILISLILTLWSVGAAAHNVLGGVYVIGDQVEGEIGFSNGDMAPAGSPVTVTDAEGRQIAATTTNEDGFFTFKVTQRIDHFIAADLGSGHIFKYVLKSEELPDSLGSTSVSENSAEPVVSESHQTPENSENRADAVDSAELQAMIEKAVARQIKPLRKDLNAFKEHASVSDVLGGIGYIFGLCGLGIWFNQRKKGQTKDTGKA